jgi:hypothetical protein
MTNQFYISNDDEADVQKCTGCAEKNLSKGRLRQDRAEEAALQIKGRPTGRPVSADGT